MSTASGEELFRFLKHTHDSIQPLSRRITFDKAHKLHSHIIFLYGSIIELTGSCILLIDNQIMTAVPVILRSILEAYVDIHNLIKEPRYGHSLEISNLQGSLSLIKVAIAGNNQYLQSGDHSTLEFLQAQERRIKDELKALESKGHKYMSIEARFRKAGMFDEYKSIYSVLSSESHNNLNALIDRHTELKTGDFDVMVYRPYSWDDYKTHVGLNAEILVRASMEVHECFSSPAQGDLDPLRHELNRLRGDQ